MSLITLLCVAGSNSAYISFGSSHTGLALANSVLEVLRKFRIQDRVRALRKCLSVNGAD